MFFDSPDFPEGLSAIIEGDGGEAEFTIPITGLKHIDINTFGENNKFCTYYDNRGNVIDNESPASQIGSIVYDNDFNAWNLIKKGDKIFFRSISNPLSSSCHWSICLEYDFGSRFIYIETLRGKPIELIDVIYNGDLKITENAGIRTSQVTIDNSGLLQSSWEIEPFINKPATVYIDTPDNHVYVIGRDFTMKVPFWAGGKWELVEKNDLRIDTSNLFYQDDTYANVTIDIPANSKLKVFTDVIYSKAEGEGSMVFQNTMLDRRISIPFFVQTTAPVNFDIRINEVQ
ncbi:MAG: hypothetical protein K2K97_11090 [Muribaculaceae bacterium]|nr:hypothetical protein [Muribaculaceae bacterium]